MIRMYHSLYTVFILTMIAVLSTEIFGCGRSSSSGSETTPIMPSLKEQPEIEGVTLSSIGITWKKDHYGDGQICGYFVSLKSPSSMSRENVGFVPFSTGKNVYRYTIDRLDAKTLYGISVTILHCSGEQGKKSPELWQETTEYTPPTLLEAPQNINLTSSRVTLRWTSQHQGDGPICGYIINIRANGNEEPWLSVGFVPVNADLEYLIDHLEDSTAYQVAVALTNCFYAREGPLEPILQIKTLPIVLPTLSEVPQNTNLTSSSVALRWTNQYEGDGPICGYVIFIRVNGDEEPWLSVGFVPVDADLEYEINHLEANTAYQVAVALTNCFSAREGPLEPILQIKTLPSALPTLSEAPQIISLTSSSMALRWTNQHQGEGPICGYVIYSRVDGDEEPWLSVGVVPADVDLEYEIDRLEANTAYQVAVALTNCFSGREGPLEPILQIRTLPLTLPTLSRAPQITSLTSSTMAVQWTNQHRGEGPICGYVIYIGVNGEEDSWLSVGFVPVDADLEYEIDHLEANTDYQVAVTLVNCFSARQGPLEPVLHLRTLPSEASQSPAVGQNRTTGYSQHKPLNSRHMYWIFAAPALAMLVPIILSFLLYKTWKKLMDSKQKRMYSPSNQCSSKVNADIVDVTNDAQCEEAEQRALTEGTEVQVVALMKNEDD